MNDEDMSEIIQKISSMINNSSLNNTTDTSSENNNSQENCSNINFDFNNNKNNSNNNLNLDFETLLKIKNIIDKINSNKNSPESNLLLALKPYLNDSRKNKVDKYIQLLNISKIFESFNFEKGDINNK